MKLRLTVILLAACIALAGCSSSIIDNIDPPVASKLTGEELNAQFKSELTGPELPPLTKPKDAICIDYTGRGLLRICYKNNSSAKLKLQVIFGGKEDDTVYYDLKGDGSIEDFSLQFGNGKYTARIMQNSDGDIYSAVKSKSFDVDMADPNLTFLNSVQNVNWNYGMVPIQDVKNIVAGSLASPKNGDLKYSCACDIYAYVVKNIKYDNGKIDNLTPDYLPDIEETYADKTGICYDYSSLFASMLRSIGIPAKLVKGYAGYAPDSYHAWNEVYIDNQWSVIDTTRDATLLAGGEKFDIIKKASDYSIVHEY